MQCINTVNYYYWCVLHILYVAEVAFLLTKLRIVIFLEKNYWNSARNKKSEI